MPLRDRMRKAFGRQSSSSSPAEDLSPKRTKSQKAELYKVGDAMPKPKYPGRYNKPHQDMLKSFSFADAWSRRKSDLSGVSPTGSRAVSRNNSGVAPRKSTGHRPGSVGQLAESVEGEDDVMDVGLSRPLTADRDPKMHRHDSALEDASPGDPRGKPLPNGRPEFTRDELSSALKKTSLQVPRVNGAA
ncbi:MAG: hypothetical protein M1837_005344 [Sclerophora amabilis]|nr:MAG: hypothetical protein M1837_005344 [Sclerophora amabilis]